MFVKNKKDSLSSNEKLLKKVVLTKRANGERVQSDINNCWFNVQLTIRLDSVVRDLYYTTIQVAREAGFN